MNALKISLAVAALFAAVQVSAAPATVAAAPMAAPAQAAAPAPAMKAPAKKATAAKRPLNTKVMPSAIAVGSPAANKALRPGFEANSEEVHARAMVREDSFNSRSGQSGFVPAQPISK